MSTPSRSDPPRFRRDDTVGWAGSAELTEQFHLTAGHPGVVGFDDPMSVTVRWVDKQGWFSHVGVFQQEWLEPIDQAEFDRRADELRRSGWSGFPPGEY